MHNSLLHMIVLDFSIRKKSDGINDEKILKEKGEKGAFNNNLYEEMLHLTHCFQSHKLLLFAHCQTG